MFLIKNNSKNCFWVFVLTLFISFASGRQTRFNRYNTEIIEDSVENQSKAERDDKEVEATVREIKLTPYPDSGFKPSRKFSLPNEASNRNTQKADMETHVTEKSVTEIINLITTTEEYESELTTVSHIKNDNIDEPKVYNLFKSDHQERTDGPIEIPRVNMVIKAPYPAAGYRPMIPFFLPLEQVIDENKMEDNSKHPVCGSSTHPLSPKPLDSNKTDPDSESINIRSQSLGKIKV